MREWRKAIGALCIVFAMVLGAFAGFAYARNAGIVGASPGAGTRDAGGASGPIAFSEETPETPSSSGDTSLAKSDSVVASDGQDVARKVSAAELRQAVRDGLYNVQTDDGMITATESTPSTRYSGPVTVQGWDGYSVIITISSGINFSGTSPYWYVFPASSGFEFTPKNDLVLDRLYWYQWFSRSGRGASVRIWDTATQLTIAQCTPPFTTFSWVFCTLSTPVTVIAGQKYRIPGQQNVDYFPYWMGFYGPPGTLPPYSPPVPTKITVGNFFYTWGPPVGGPINAYPAPAGGSNVIMMVDFRWTETLIRPDVAQGASSLQVMKVAPIAAVVAQDPIPGH